MLQEPIESFLILTECPTPLTQSSFPVNDAIYCGTRTSLIKFSWARWAPEHLRNSRTQGSDELLDNLSGKDLHFDGMINTIQDFAITYTSSIKLA